MIKMIFEGGYTYYMAESEYMMLITLASIGAAAVIIGVMLLGRFLYKKLLDR